MTRTVDAFILAAGLGTRMGPLSRALPKPCWPLDGRTPLERTAACLRGAGLSRIACNAHHLPDLLAWVAGRAGIEVCPEPVLQGSAGGLRHVRGLATDPLAVMNADVLADPPWAAFLEAHRARRAELSWLLMPHPGGPWNPVWLSPEGRILPPGETGEGPYHFTGPALWGPRALALLPDEGPVDVKRDILPRLDRALGIVMPPFPFLEIGTPDQLIEAAALLAPAAEGRVPGCYIHPDAEPAGHLHRCVLGPGARIPASLEDHDAFWIDEGGRQVRYRLEP